jgi:predicted CXXCH cytochrome family protein
MRNLLKALLAVALVVPSLAFALNISQSKHNLSTTQAAPNVRTNWDEICVFCHTPHNSAGQTRLLWNRTVPTNVGWAAGNTTTAGTQLPLAGQVQGVSAMCLSCHDGATAIGNVTNPSNRIAVAIAYNGTNVSTTGQINGVLTRLGTNMQGAHPVSVPYPRTGRPGYASIAVSGGDPTTYVTPVTTGCLGSAQCAGNVAVPLYTDTSGRMGIECGSCHDAHDNANGSFLRISNASSALCLACHIK